MSYSEHWRREFLTRHPEYESQSQVRSQEAVQLPAPVSFVLPLSTFITANSELSTQLFLGKGQRGNIIPCRTARHLQISSGKYVFYVND